VYDQGTKHLEIYAVGTDGQLQENWWQPSQWYSGQLPTPPSRVTTAVAATGLR
jgi:hypothetical protein